MDEELYKEFRYTMLRKLFNAKKIGGSHTHIKHMQNAVQRHLRGVKEARRALKDLINEGLVLTKPTTQELHVSLNPRKIKEVKKVLGII